MGSNLSLDKRSRLYKLDGVKGLDLIALDEANAALEEEYLRFMRTERKNGFRYLRHLKASLSDASPQYKHVEYS